MRNNQRNKKGFTLTELLVLVAAGAILTGTLLPSLSENRQKMLQAACASNLKQWGMVFQLYADDFNGTINVGIPAGTAGMWYRVGGSYRMYCGDKGVVNQRRILKMKMCPAQSLSPQTLALLNSGPISTADAITPGYEMIRLSPASASFRAWCIKNCTHPSSTAIMLDSDPSCSYAVFGPNLCGADIIGLQSATNRHFGGCNVLWADMHVTWESWNAIAVGVGIPPIGTPPGQYWFSLVGSECNVGSPCYEAISAMTSCK